MDNHYIAGFTDGEGTFHIGFQRRKDLKFNWQIVPEFHINQNWTSLDVLKTIRDKLKCGYIKTNHAKSSRDRTYVYIVRKRHDLIEKIIPFFDAYILHTEKRHDFSKFKEVLNMLEKSVHLTKGGFEKIAKIAYSMNSGGRYRKFRIEDILNNMESSETIR